MAGAAQSAILTNLDISSAGAIAVLSRARLATSASRAASADGALEEWR
jgi:hypothetical protein